ncbi:MAG TPA: rhomboid family intramembrane serine protease [Thermoanaerobaculia bacterium]|jgi:rhomboid protease GluP
MNRRRQTPATFYLLVAIAAGFVFEIVSGAWLDAEKLAEYGAIVPEYVFQHHQYWRLVSAMFLHGDGSIGGDLLHLAMNAFALFQLGTLYEMMFGTRRFLLIYFVTGIAASITSALHINGASVGASGAIFGILGAFVFSVLRSPLWRHERWARSVVFQCVGWIIVNIAIGQRIPQIDNAAHIGGLVTGLILGFVLPHRVPPPPPNRSVIDVQPGSFEG